MFILPPSNIEYTKLSSVPTAKTIYIEDWGTLHITPNRGGYPAVCIIAQWWKMAEIFLDIWQCLHGTFYPLSSSYTYLQNMYTSGPGDFGINAYPVFYSIQVFSSVVPKSGDKFVP